MIRVRFSLILVLFVVLAVGCDKFTPAAPTFTVRDSAGIEIVESWLHFLVLMLGRSLKSLCFRLGRWRGRILTYS